MHVKMPNRISHSICLLALIATSVSCSDRDLIPMQLSVPHSLSKLPFVIALDQGLYEKYGLDMEVKLGPPDFDGGMWMPSNAIVPRTWRRFRSITGAEVFEPNIWVSGANSRIVDMATSATEPHWLFLAATDCVIRQHILADDTVIASCSEPYATP